MLCTLLLSFRAYKTIMGCTSSKATTATSAQHDSLGATERVMKGRRGIDKSERIHTPSERARLALSRAKSMAITSSSSPTNDSATAAQDPLPPPPKLNSEGQLIAEEVVKRISGSVESKDCILGVDSRSAELLSWIS